MATEVQIPREFVPDDDVSLSDAGLAYKDARARYEASQRAVDHNEDTHKALEREMWAARNEYRDAAAQLEHSATRHRPPPLAAIPSD